MMWYPDTSFNYHVTHDIQSWSITKEYRCFDNLHLGTDQGLHISHMGVVNVPRAKDALVLIMFFTSLPLLRICYPSENSPPISLNFGMIVYFKD